VGPGEAQHLISAILSGAAKQVPTRAQVSGRELRPLLDRGDELGPTAQSLSA